MLYNFLKKNAESLIAALIGFIIIRLFTMYSGVGISPDSVSYCSAARNFVAGNGFIDYAGNPMVLFPVAYPLFLGLIMFVTHTDIITLAPYLNGLMFGSVIFISGYTMDKFIHKTNWYKRIVLLVLLCSPSLIDIYYRLWSETLFILFVLIFINTFYLYLRNGQTRQLIISGIVTAIAFDTRYAGITIIGTAFLLIFFNPQFGWLKKIGHIFIYGAVGSSFVILNLIRNITERGLVTGLRQKSITPFSKNIEFSSNVVSDWLQFDILRNIYFEIFFILLFILFFVFFIHNRKKHLNYTSFENISVAFFIVYVSFIIISSTLSRYETINNRLLVPAFIPFVWISTCQIPKWRQILSVSWMRTITFVFIVGISALLIGSYLLTNKNNFSYMSESGIPGYSEDEWTHLEVVQKLKQNYMLTNNHKLYSNHPQAVYFLLGKYCTQLPEKAYQLEKDKFLQTDKAVLIWINLYDNPDLLGMNDISKMKNIKLLVKTKDGAIYSITKK